MPSNREIVLASASPQRRDLLSKAGIPHRVVPSGIDEPEPESFPSPESYVLHVAWLKGRAVAPRHDALVLSADTCAALGKQVIGKPRDRDDAERILKTLMGTIHEIWTGVCLFLPGASIVLSTSVRSLVHFRLLNDVELDRYLDTGEWRDKAGAYGVQCRDDPFVENVEGSISNVIGLPIDETLDLISMACRLAD